MSQVHTVTLYRPPHRIEQTGVFHANSLERSKVVLHPSQNRATRPRGINGLKYRSSEMPAKRPGHDAPVSSVRWVWYPGSSLLLLQHRPLLRDLDVVDPDVHLVHAQAGEVLHAVDHVPPDGVADPGYGLPVRHGQGQVYGGLFFADLDGYAPGEVAAGAPGNALQ